MAQLTAGQRAIDNIAGTLSSATRSALAEAMHPTSLVSGQVLVHQGETGDSFHIVVEGRLDVVAHSRDGKELIFRSLGPGEPIGELTLVDGAPRLATVRASGTASVLSISRARFLALAMEHAELGLWLAGLCCDKVRRLSAWAEDASFEDTAARLAHLLIDLATETSGPGDVAATTQQDLADRLGVTRESVNKLLRSWESDGLVALSRGKVTLSDRTRLVANIA